MGLQVLLVEDDALLADGLLRALQAQDMTVTLVGDGLAADARLQSAGAVEVVVLDIGLPGIDGLELARRLRAQPGTAGAMLVAITGYGQESDRAQVAQAGFDHHLVKPIDTDRLYALLAGARG